MKKNILLIGQRNIGKTEFISRIINEITLPVSGFTNRTTATDENGFHAIYLYPLDGDMTVMNESNHIGDCDTKTHIINTEVFENLGVEILSNVKNGVVIMDELGFMESKAENFKKMVLEIFDSELPVIAVIKDRDDIEFLNTLKNHKDSIVLSITRDNKEKLFEDIMNIVKTW